MKKNSYSKNTVGLLYRNLREKTAVVRTGGERRGNFYTISRGKLQIKINLQLTKKLQTGVLLRKKVNSFNLLVSMCSETSKFLNQIAMEKAKLTSPSSLSNLWSTGIWSTEEVSGKGYSGGDIPMLFKYYSFLLSRGKKSFFLLCAYSAIHW